MEDRPPVAISTRRPPRRVLLLLLAALLLPTTGCMGFANYMLYAIYGPPPVPAEFEQIEGRVAVVCVSKAAYGPNSVASVLARAVGANLQRELKDEVEIVSQDEIENWIDRNDWDHIEYREIGKGVNADYVIAIDLNAPIQLREGPTLFRGRADLTVSVYDLKQNGKIVFRRHTPDFSHPANARGDVSETQFRRIFVAKLSHYVSRYFHPYQFSDDFGDNF